MGNPIFWGLDSATYKVDDSIEFSKDWKFPVSGDPNSPDFSITLQPSQLLGQTVAELICHCAEIVGVSYPYGNTPIKWISALGQDQNFPYQFPYYDFSYPQILSPELHAWLLKSSAMELRNRMFQFFSQTYTSSSTPNDNRTYWLNQEQLDNEWVDGVKVCDWPMLLSITSETINQAPDVTGWPQVTTRISLNSVDYSSNMTDISKTLSTRNEENLGDFEPDVSKFFAPVCQHLYNYSILGSHGSDIDYGAWFGSFWPSYTPKYVDDIEKQVIGIPPTPPPGSVGWIQLPTTVTVGWADIDIWGEVVIGWNGSSYYQVSTNPAYGMVISSGYSPQNTYNIHVTYPGRTGQAQLIVTPFPAFGSNPINHSKVSISVYYIYNNLGVKLPEGQLDPMPGTSGDILKPCSYDWGPGQRFTQIPNYIGTRASKSLFSDDLNSIYNVARMPVASVVFPKAYGWSGGGSELFSGNAIVRTESGYPSNSAYGNLPYSMQSLITQAKSDAISNSTTANYALSSANFPYDERHYTGYVSQTDVGAPVNPNYPSGPRYSYYGYVYNRRLIGFTPGTVINFPCDEALEKGWVKKVTMYLTTQMGNYGVTYSRAVGINNNYSNGQSGTGLTWEDIDLPEWIELPPVPNGYPRGLAPSNTIIYGDSQTGWRIFSPFGFGARKLMKVWESIDNPNNRSDLDISQNITLPDWDPVIEPNFYLHGTRGNSYGGTDWSDNHPTLDMNWSYWPVVVVDYNWKHPLNKGWEPEEVVP